MNVIGYARVSTSEQSVIAQTNAIHAECDRRGWTMVALYEDTAMSGSIPWKDRPGLSAAIAALEKETEPTVLMCAKLDRLSRSLVDFAGILERSRKKKWPLVLLDFGLDLTTPVGEMVAGILAAVAQFERRRIGERTKDALAVKKASGVHCGRPSNVHPSTVTDICSYRDSGQTYKWIADRLNTELVPTGQGAAAWRDTAVRAVYLAAK